MTQGRATQGTPAEGRPLLNRRLAAFGTTIFAEMSALAVRTGSINLGQGFPDTDGPEEIREAAVRALRAGHGNQYPPGPGVPELRTAVAAHQERFYGLTWSPDTEVLVTTGATEAIAASLLALLEPGDEVIAFEPYYDSYAACIAMAGAKRVPLTLRAPDFRPDLDELRTLITPRTRLLLLNTPHNPTGAVLTPTNWPGSRPSRWSTICWWSPTRCTSTWSSRGRTTRSPPCPGCAGARSPSPRRARRSRTRDGRSAGSPGTRRWWPPCVRRSSI